MNKETIVIDGTINFSKSIGITLVPLLSGLFG